MGRPDERLLVIGASLGGLRAVEAARKAGFTGEITLVGGEDCLPYDRPPLSKAFLDDPAAEAPLFRSESYLCDEMEVRLRLGSRATAVDPARRVVEAGGAELPYTWLVLATGANARPLSGADGLAGVHPLRTLEDAVAIRAALDAGARTVVIGAGFIGSEVASGARKRGLPVTIVEALPTPLVRAVGEQMGAVCASLHDVNGTDLRCGAGVDAVEGNGAVQRVRLSDGTILPADLVVVGIGATPATEWLNGSGIEVDDGVVCDARLAASQPGVFAAGDVARWHNPLFDRSMRLEHWTSAAEQAATAVRNALDPSSAKPYATVPYFWSDWYDRRIQFVGVPAAEEIQVVSGSTDERKFVALYREGDRLCGALAMNQQREIMKYRALIAKRCSWTDALAFARSRHQLQHP